MKAVLLFVSAFLISMTSSANQLTGPAWVCDLDANVEGFSAGFILNVTEIEGYGEIVCSRPADQMYVTVPVMVKLGGVGFGFGISKVKDMQVYTLNVGVTDPADMLGKFNAGLEADFTFIAGGAGVQVGVKGNNGLSFDVGVSAKQAEGLHLKAGGFAMTVKQVGEAYYTPWAQN